MDVPVFLVVYLVMLAVIAFALYWVIRLAVTAALRTIERERNQRTQ